MSLGLRLWNAGLHFHSTWSFLNPLALKIALSLKQKAEECAVHAFHLCLLGYWAPSCHSDKCSITESKHADGAGRLLKVHTWKSLTRSFTARIPPRPRALIRDEINLTKEIQVPTIQEKTFIEQPLVMIITGLWSLEPFDVKTDPCFSLIYKNKKKSFTLQVHTLQKKYWRSWKHRMINKKMLLKKKIRRKKCWEMKNQMFPQIISPFLLHQHCIKQQQRLYIICHKK